MSDRSGFRGGSVPPITLSEVQALFETWRASEYGYVRALILLTAAERGEFHADDLAHLALPQPNVIGAAVNALARAHLLEKRNRSGEIEHRKGAAEAAHARASYVWRATPAGIIAARRLYVMRRERQGFWAEGGFEPKLTTNPEQMRLG
jgi:hypothetical protein